MNFLSLIEQKREGKILARDQIQEFIREFTAGKIPDYQMAAMLMAIYFRGLNTAETTALTLAMRDSGEVLTFPKDARPLVDKHSTGGIGDKVSLPLAPLLAGLGFRVPMISGRGLGITGGTLDKLDAIPGFKTLLPAAQIVKQVQQVGCVICGQTDTMVPADKKIYALRDDVLGGQQRFESGNGIQLVEGAAGDAEAASGNHRHAEAEAGEQRRERERNLVADAAGGMFVHERSLVPRKFKHVAGIAHGERERSGLGGVEAAKIDGHEQRGHLVVGNYSGGEFADEFLDLFWREGFPLALGFNDSKKVHFSVGGLLMYPCQTFIKSSANKSGGNEPFGNPNIT